MQKSSKIILTTAILIACFFLIVLKTPLFGYLFTTSASHIFKSEISAKKCVFSFLKGVILQDIEIKSKEGLNCNIKDAVIKYYPAGALKKQLIVNCSLKKVSFTKPSSEIINGILGLFDMSPLDLLEFDTVDGLFYLSKKETIVKDLNAKGEDVGFFANGTSAEKNVVYSLKLILSEKITSKISKDIRNFFFRKQDVYSTVELYISGDPKKPSINFSTPLFKLRIK